MKKLFFIFLILILASSASATVYKWVDEKGVVNFVDDYSKVPPGFQNKVEEMNMPKMRPASSPTTSGKTIVAGQSGETAKQPPPVSQTLVREGDFAIRLAESLKMGKPQGEAEAENMLASAGIAPKNGWIADYPLTPDIIGELERTVGEAADARRLPMGRNDALKVFRTTAVELELPIVAEVPEGYTESPPPTTPEYTEPGAIDNYYYAEGPPVITYYPPPWDYYYMYGWVPSPFWYAGFYFPGYFILNDFHRFHHGHGHHGDGHHGDGHHGDGHHGDGHDSHVVTNHVRDPQTGRIGTVDPTRRGEGRTGGVRGATTNTKGFSSTEARTGAQSIFERSRGAGSSSTTSISTTGRGTNNRTPSNATPGRSNGGQVYNKRDAASGFNGRNNIYSRPPAVNRSTSRMPGQTFSPGTSNRTFSQPGSMNRQYGMNSPRPFAGGTRSFSPPSQGSQRFSMPQSGQRSFSPSLGGGGQHFNSSPGGGFSGSHQGGGGGLSGFHQGGGGGGFGRGR